MLKFAQQVNLHEIFSTRTLLTKAFTGIKFSTYLVQRKGVCSGGGCDSDDHEMDLLDIPLEQKIFVAFHQHVCSMSHHINDFAVFAL